MFQLTTTTCLLAFAEYRTLIAFNNTPHILKALHEDRFGKQRKRLLKHLSYITKVRTKDYSKAERSFGRSI
ncbi:YagK/YfjJ domain-containing protein [Citrobacter tructae]|uniref:YagK/YfjJ domain-containing protein n=1 Tax=Citrobacter tructae TaxID=2562449 RepID=UPI003F54EF04